MIKISLDDKVKFKITNSGLQALENDFEEDNRLFNGALGDYISPKIDEEGYTTCTLETFIRIIDPSYIEKEIYISERDSNDI